MQEVLSPLPGTNQTWGFWECGRRFQHSREWEQQVRGQALPWLYCDFQPVPQETVSKTIAKLFSSFPLQGRSQLGNHFYFLKRKKRTIITFYLLCVCMRACIYVYVCTGAHVCVCMSMPVHLCECVCVHVPAMDINLRFENISGSQFSPSAMWDQEFYGKHLLSTEPSILQVLQHFLFVCLFCSLVNKSPFFFLSVKPCLTHTFWWHSLVANRTCLCSVTAVASPPA